MPIKSSFSVYKRRWSEKKNVNRSDNRELH